MACPGEVWRDQVTAVLPSALRQQKQQGRQQGGGSRAAAAVAAGQAAAVAAAAAVPASPKKVLGQAMLEFKFDKREIMQHLDHLKVDAS